MKVEQSLTKVWQNVRDEAAESSAIIHVVNAEQWVKRLIPLLSKKTNLSAKDIYSKIDTDLSGYQASYAYEIIRCYWEHAELLVWESFSEFLSAVPRQSARR